MKKFLIVIAAFVAASALALAQGLQPVSWSATAEHVDGDRYQIRLTPAFSEAGWHIYDLGPYEGGPNATEISFEGNVKLIGEPSVEGVDKEYDEIFEMEIGTCTEGAVFCQEVEATSGKDATVTINVSWQACKDGACLLIEDETLSVVIPASSCSSACCSCSSWTTVCIVAAVAILLIVLLALKRRKAARQ